MTAADAPGTLDRIVFATTETGGAYTVTSSLNEGELAGWVELLRDHVALDTRDQPSVSLFYASDGGGAALLRRVHHAGGGTNGTGDRCHALVGWHGDLTPELALRLHSWKGWSGHGWSGPRLRWMDLAYSQFEYARPHDLDRVAAAHMSSLIPLVAAVLRDPHRPISVLSPPSGLTSRVALLWGLRTVVGDLLDVPGEPPFTFSTFEARHAAGGSAVPRVAFLPYDAPDAFPAAHRVVRLPAMPGRDGGPGGPGGPDGPGGGAAGAGRDDAYTHAARALVASFVGGGSAAVRDWLDQRRVRASNSVADRVDRVLDTVDGVPSPEPDADAARRDGTRNGTRDGARDGVPAAEQDGDEDAEPEHAATVHALAELDLAQLADADPDTVRRVVRSLARTDGRPDGRPDGRLAGRRAEARELLLRDPGWEWALAIGLSPCEAEHAVDAVVRFAFLPDLLAEDVRHQVATLVCTLDSSSRVLESLVRLVVEQGEHGVLLEAAGLRWLRERGHPVAELEPPIGRPQQREQRTYLHLLPHGAAVMAPRPRASQDG